MVSESEFEEKAISDLESEEFNVINMGGGTFDLFIELESGLGGFVELKVASKSYKNQRHTDDKKKGISLASQTEAIKKMHGYPTVFACDKDDIEKCYLVLPSRMKVLSDYRLEVKDYDDILIGVDHLKEKPYSRCIEELTFYLNKDMRRI